MEDTDSICVCGKVAEEPHFLDDLFDAFWEDETVFAEGHEDVVDYFGAIGDHLEPTERGYIASDAWFGRTHGTPAWIFDAEAGVAAPWEDEVGFGSVVFHVGLDVRCVVRVEDEVEGFGNGVEVDERGRMEDFGEVEDEFWVSQKGSEHLEWLFWLWWS